MKSNPILPEKLITEISVIISEFETITDPHYKKNYRSVKVIPLIRKCRDYLTFYHNNHDDFLEMQEEYLALCNLYGYHAIDIPFSIEGYSKLHDEIERIKTQSKKSAEQAYIQQVLDDVMTEMGYSVIGRREVTKRNGKHFRNELYTFGEGTAVNVTYSSDGRIAMELGGLDTSDRMPTEGECTALCAEMEEFCTDFKEIEKRLLSKGVILANRVSLLPPKGHPGRRHGGPGGRGREARARPGADRGGEPIGGRFRPGIDRHHPAGALRAGGGGRPLRGLHRPVRPRPRRRDPRRAAAREAGAARGHDGVRFRAKR